MLNIGFTATQSKSTPNVRKILQSMKTFANHLDDFEAMQGSADNNPLANAATVAREQPPKPSNSRRKPPPKSASSSAKGTPKAGTPKPQADIIMSDSSTPILTPLSRATEDVEMADDDKEEDTKRQVLTINGVDNVETLLAARVPDTPSDAELRALLAVPPLTYTQARAGRTEEDARYPVRTFCSVCGYWGKVKCVKCGTRVCALDCLDLHREECVSRYGL